MFFVHQSSEVENLYGEHLKKLNKDAPLQILRACKVEFIYEDYYMDAEVYVLEKNGKRFIYVSHSHPDYDIDRIPALTGEKELQVYDDLWALWEEEVLEEEDIDWLEKNLPLIDFYELYRKYK